VSVAYAVRSFVESLVIVDFWRVGVDGIPVKTGIRRPLHAFLYA